MKKYFFIFLFLNSVGWAGSFSIDLGKTTFCVKKGFELGDLTLALSEIDGCVRHRGFPLVISKVLQFENVTLAEASVLFEFEVNQENAEGLGLFLPVVGENWQIYLNGKLIQAAWSESDSFQRQTVKAVTVGLKGAKAGTNHLLIRLRGDIFTNGIIKNDNFGFFMGDHYQIANLAVLERMRINEFSLMLIGVFFFFGIYHIFIHFFAAKREQSKLFFGLFSLMLSCYLFLISNFAYDTFAGASTLFIQLAEFASLYSLLPLFLLFLVYHFNQKLNLMHKVIIYSAGVFLVFNFPGFEIAKMTLRTWQLFILPCCLYLLYFIVSLSIKDRRAWPMAIGIGIAVGAAVFDVVASLSRISNLRFFIYAFAIFVFLVVLEIAYRLFAGVKETEKLNDQLEEQNQAIQKHLLSR